MRCAPTFSVSVFDSCSCFPGWIHGCETSLFVVPQQQALAGGKLWYSFFFFFFSPQPRTGLLLARREPTCFRGSNGHFVRCLPYLLLFAW